MAMQRPYLVLGLDPGIASCGFCLIDLANHKILLMGVRLFSVPKNRAGVSLAAERRAARSARRNNQRTKSRLKRCLTILKAAGLVPEDADRGWLQARKKDKPVIKLRAAGLDRVLSDRELAQVLYSLCEHRGYIPHGEGKEGATDDADGKKVLSAIKKNMEDMAKGGYRTVGEMLCAQGRSRNRGGNYDRCVYNSQIQEEARAIFAAQRSFGNLKVTAELEQEYMECLTSEKSSSDHDRRSYEVVGSCVYFPELKRAAKADISSELCRAYERFGHLVIVHKNGNEQTLTHEQINRYISALFMPSALQKKAQRITYATIRKDLDISGTSVFKGISHEQEKNEVFEPKAWRCLSKCLAENHGELLDRMWLDRALADSVCEALTYASTEVSLKGQLETLDLSEDECRAIKAIPFNSKIFKGYGTRSIKALSLLVGAFEDPDVRTLADAERATGLDMKRAEDRMPRSIMLPPYSAYDPTCRNPVVLRAMGQMRKIVNAIIKDHGVPDEIHIELSRDLKMSKREKDAIAKRQRSNEAANKKWAALAAGILDCEPSEVPHLVIRKLALREEQGDKDVYTGAAIDLERLVADDHYCEIDHILPYSRTGMSGWNNEVLVLAASNQKKRERTPYEWMQQDAGKSGVPAWDAYSSRVAATIGNPRKRRNLLCMDTGKEAMNGFLLRDLNDTRYMSVAIKNYLEDCLLFPEDGRKLHVTAVSGGATASLRRVWGLNTKGSDDEKTNSDTMRNAIDAAVIAACSVKTVQAVAKTRSLGRETFRHMRRSRLADTQPWETFADDVLAKCETVIPTRMAEHGVTGCALNEFVYRIDGFNEKGYAILSRQIDRATGERGVQVAGNYAPFGAGSAKLVGQTAFIRLWHDPDFGKGGRWYVEPVYYKDIPTLHDISYQPRYILSGRPRTEWPPVPEAALSRPPLILFSGDILVVGNHIARFKRLDINSQKLVMLNIFDERSLVKDFPTISRWKGDTNISIFSEDVLGKCFESVDIDSESSTFTLH